MGFVVMMALEAMLRVWDRGVKERTEFARYYMFSMRCTKVSLDSRLVSRRERASRTQRRSFAMKRESLKSAQTAQTRSSTRHSQTINDSTAFADGPLQRQFQELAALAQGNSKLELAVRRVSQLMTRNRAWEPNLRDLLNTNSRSEAGGFAEEGLPPNVQADEETIEWLVCARAILHLFPLMDWK